VAVSTNADDKTAMTDMAVAGTAEAAEAEAAETETQLDSYA
jgi:hypothetical protein